MKRGLAAMGIAAAGKAKPSRRMPDRRQATLKLQVESSAQCLVVEALLVE